MMEMLEKIEKEMKTLKEEGGRHRMGAEELKKLERNREDRISKIEGKVEELERMLKECIDRLEISEQRGGQEFFKPTLAFRIWHSFVPRKWQD